MRGSIIKLWRMELGWKLYIYKRAHVACAKLTFMSSLFLSVNISPPSSLPSPSSETLNFQHFPQSNTHALISKEFRKFCWILLWELENWKHFNHDSFNWCLAWIWWKLHFPICCTSDTWVGSAEEEKSRWKEIQVTTFKLFCRTILPSKWKEHVELRNLGGSNFVEFFYGPYCIQIV